MELTYIIKENGYDILKDGVLWITQYEPYIPNPTLSYEDNAKAQISSIMEITPTKTEIELLQEEMELQKQTILELSMMLTGGVV